VGTYGRHGRTNEEAVIELQMRTKQMKSVAIGIALAMLCSTGYAQTYPYRPVKIVVPYTPGGGTDTVARAISQKLAEKWGQPVVVENRPGAGTTLGADFVAKAPRDGYTLLFSDSSSFVINPNIYKTLPFDPLKNLEPPRGAVGASPGDGKQCARKDDP
jgi:tripartite-type tricarboxylate transporter receptor subunit TctC